MKTVTVLLFFLIVSSTTCSIFNGIHIYKNLIKPTVNIQDTLNTVKVGFFQQALDHFNPQDGVTFLQKYYSIDDYYEPEGPIFLFLGSNGPANENILQSLYLDDIAKELNGILFYLEHRFYGDSMPKGNVTTEILRYLTPYQALEDIANFITYVKSSYIPTNVKSRKVFVVGGDYSGGLAVWFRQKYPHLATGAWVSSAGLEARLDNSQYNEIVGDVYRSIGGNECYHLIENGFKQMDEMIETNRSAELSKIFGLCDDMGIDKRDTWVYFSYLSQIFPRLLYAVEFKEIVQYTCEFLKNETANTSEMQALADFHATLGNLNGTCYVVNLKEVINTYQQEDPLDLINYLGIRQFVYQECSILGWFPTSKSKYQPFGNNIPVDTLYEICQGVFGDIFTRDRMNENENLFNEFNGALTPNVKKVIFTQAEWNPFRSLGIQSPLNDETPTFIIPGYTFEADLIKYIDGASTNLKDIQNNIKAILTKWATE